MISPPTDYFCGMSEQLRKQVGAAVKAARKGKMTQLELAAEVGLQQSNIAKLEAGSYNISLDTLEKIAVALGMNVEVLLK